MAREKIGEGYVEARLDGSKLRADATQLERGIGQSMQRIGTNLQQSGAVMTRRLTLPLVAAGGAIVKVAADFETGMNRVRAVSGATGTEFDALRNQAMELGRTTQFSAAQAADAMGFLAMAGFDANEILGAMPATLTLAASANLDLGRSADIVSNIMTGYGIQVSDLGGAVDVLAMAFTSSNTDLGQLGDAFKYAGPVAKGAGISFEETAAALGLMGSAGIQASMAGTSLRGAITRLLNPTGQVAAKLKELGIEALTADGNLKPLHDIIGQLETSGASTADMMLIFGQRAGPAMATLVEQGSDALRDFTATLEDSGGTAQRIADIQMEGMRGAFLRMKSAAEGFAIAIGDSGLLNDVASFAELLAGLFRSLAETNPELLRNATMLLGIAAAIGPVKWAMGGLIRGIGTLLTGAMSPWTLAIGAGITALALWARAKQEARAKVEEFKETLDQTTGAITDMTRELAMSKLQQEGALVPARQLGISMADLRDAALGMADPYARVRARLDEVTGSVSNLGDSTTMTTDEQIAFLSAVNAIESALGIVQDPLAAAAAETRELAEANAEAAGGFLDLEHAVDDAADAAHLWRGGVKLAGDAAGDAIDPTAELGGVVGDLAGEFEDGEEAARGMLDAMVEYNDVVRAMFDPVFKVRQAIEKFADAQARIAETTAPDFEGSQRDIEAALWDEIEAGLELDGALRELWGAMDDGQTSSEGIETKLRFLEDQYGVSRDAAILLLDELDNFISKAEEIPEIEIEIDTRQRKKFDDLIAHLDRELAKKREGEVGVKIDRASFRAADGALNALAGRRTAAIHVELRGQTAARNELGRFTAGRAEGGPVWPGLGTWVGEEGPEFVLWGSHGNVLDADTSESLRNLMTSGPQLGALGAPPSPALFAPPPPAPDTGSSVTFDQKFYGNDTRGMMQEALHLAELHVARRGGRR